MQDGRELGIIWGFPSSELLVTHISSYHSSHVLEVFPMSPRNTSDMKKAGGNRSCRPREHVHYRFIGMVVPSLVWESRTVAEAMTPEPATTSTSA